ncbi:MAG TPA: T9SS type A sorting domain-containing protein [Rubricoccaceae bacterium]|jgi:hypothetical protein
MRCALLLLALSLPATASAQVVVSVSTNRAVYTPADTIQVAITATNPTSGAVTLQFNGGEQGNFSLNGASSFCGWITESTELTIGPGESYTWGGPDDHRGAAGIGCWDYVPGSSMGWQPHPRLAPGTYTVQGYVVRRGPGSPIYGEAETTITVVDVLASEGGAGADGYALGPVAPNPVHGVATLTLRAPTAAALTLDVLDALGRVVRTVPVSTAGGETRVALDVRGLPAGAYVARVAGRPGLMARFVVAR